MTNLARGLRGAARASRPSARSPGSTAPRRAGALDADVAGELTEAFRFLWEVRLRHQAAQVEAGEAPDDFVDPATLGPFARSGLKEAFRVIARAQRQLASEQGVEPAERRRARVDSRSVPIAWKPPSTWIISPVIPVGQVREQERHRVADRRRIVDVPAERRALRPTRR